jgi:effector-binding domain-containing protein
MPCSRLLKRSALVAVLAVPLLTLSGCNMGQYEEPPHVVTKAAEDAIEIREYKPKIVAEAVVEGERREAINAGFRLVADYIFGNNQPNAKIAMTTPVLQEPTGSRDGEKIAMTTPVIQTPEGKRWKVQFVMPGEYTMKTLPKPNNKAVTLREVPAQRVVAIRFSGRSSESNIAEHREKLLAYVKANGLKTKGEPTLAFYDPPWTLPFLRRNEVMLEVK